MNEHERQARERKASRMAATLAEMLLVLDPQVDPELAGRAVRMLAKRYWLALARALQVHEPSPATMEMAIAKIPACIDNIRRANA